MFALTSRMNDKVTVSVTTSAERRKKKSASAPRKKSTCAPKKKSATRRAATPKKSTRKAAPKRTSAARPAPKKRSAARSYRPAVVRTGSGLFHATGRTVAPLLGRRSLLSDATASQPYDLPIVEDAEGDGIYCPVCEMESFSAQYLDFEGRQGQRTGGFATETCAGCGAELQFNKRRDGLLELISVEEYAGNDWGTDEDGLGDGLSDGLAGFDEKQVSKIQDLNKKLASLDSVLGYKYRVYCAKNDEGYVLRRYAVSCEVGESAAWADDLSRFKPIGIGKVGRAKWFPKHHGVSWSFIKDNTKAEIEKKVKSFLNKNDDAAEAVKEQKKAVVRSPRTKKAAAPKAAAPKPAKTKAARPVTRKEKPAPAAAAAAAPAGAATEADLDSIEKSIDELAKLIQQSIK